MGNALGLSALLFQDGSLPDTKTISFSFDDEKNKSKGGDRKVPARQTYISDAASAKISSSMSLIANKISRALGYRFDISTS